MPAYGRLALRTKRSKALKPTRSKKLSKGSFVTRGKAAAGLKKPKRKKARGVRIGAGIKIGGGVRLGMGMKKRRVKNRKNTKGYGAGLSL